MIENELDDTENPIKLKIKIRDTFFSFYNHCLESFRFNPLVYNFFMIFSFLNLITFNLFDEYSEIYNIKKGNYIDYIKVIPRVLNISFYFKYTSNTKIYSIISFGYCLFMLILFIFIVILDKNKINQKMLYRIFFIFSFFLFWIFFFPTIDISLYLLFKIGNKKNIILEQIISGFTIFIILIFSSLHALFCNKSTIRVDCNNEFLLLITKLILVIVYNIIIKNKWSNFIIIIINIICSILLIFYNANKFLYYENSLSIPYFSCLFIYCYSSFISLVLRLLKSYKEPFWFFILGMIFLPILSKNIILKQKYYFLFGNNGETDVHHSLLNKKFFLDRYLKLLQKIKIKNIKEFYNNSLEYLVTNNEIKSYFVVLISFLNYQVIEIGNYIYVLLRIYKVFNNNEYYMKLTFQQTFSLYRIKQKCLNKMIIISSQKIDINQVIEYYKLISKFKREVLESANIHFGFWNDCFHDIQTNKDSATIKTIFEHYFVRYKQIIAKIIQMYNHNEQIEKLFLDITSIYPKDQFINLQYNEYLQNVKMEIKDEDNTNNLQGLYFKSNNDLDKIYGEENCVIICDLDNNNNLVINKCTDNVVSILGYNSHQLIGKVIEAILPPYFQQHHSEYIKNYIATGRNILFSKRKDNLFKLYGYNNSYFIVSIKIIIRQLFETEKFNKMSFISLINYVQDDYGVILVRSNGKVDSFNELFSTHIGMNIDDTNENDIYIYHIFMSLLIGYNKVSKFNMKNFYSSNEPEDNLFKLKMCNEKNFIINFRNDLKSSNKTNIKELVGMYLNSVEGSSWPTYDIKLERLEYSFYTNENREENTLYIMKIYVTDITNDNEEIEEKEEEEEKSIEKVVPKNNINNNKVIINMTSSEEENSDDEENEKIIKTFSVFSQRNSQLINILKGNEMKRVDQIEKNPGEYFIKLAQLKTLLNKRYHFNIPIFLIGIILCVSLSIIIIFMFSFYFESFNNLKISYSEICSEFSFYNDLNCLFKLYIQSKQNSTLYNKCLNNTIDKINFVNQLSKTPIINKIKFQYLDINNTETPGNDFQSLLILLNKINKNIEVTTPHFYQIVYSISNRSILINDDVFKEIKSEKKKKNLVYIFIQLGVVVVMMFLILPIVITFKKKKISILEKFYKNIFGKNKIYFEEIKTIKQSIKNFIKENDNFNLESENNEEGKNNENKKKINFDENDVNIAFTDRKKIQKKDKKNHNNFIQSYSISYIFDIIIILLLILGNIFLSLLIPIICLNLFMKFLGDTGDFLNYKMVIDTYGYSMERYMILILDIINDPSQEFIDKNDLIDLFYDGLYSSEIEFNSLTSGNNKLSSFDEIYNFLERDLCSFLDKYNFQVDSCHTLEQTNSQKGIMPIYTKVISTLSDLSQIIVNTPNNITNLVNGTSYIYIDETFDNYIISSFKIFLIQLENAYNNIINKHKIVAIVLLTFFILIVLITSLVVLILVIGRNVYNDEIDTYKLENILYKFI